jgi:hypothetical protein
VDSVPGVTLSASYGAGGSLVAPLLAEKLGFQILDRAMSASVAEHLNVTVAERSGGRSSSGCSARPRPSTPAASPSTPAGCS